jgi:EpsI family protein
MTTTTATDLNRRRTIGIAIGMGAALIGTRQAAERLRPDAMLAAQLPPLNLDAAVPKAFGEWRERITGTMVLPNPEVTANLERIYTQTLARTYVDTSGVSTMLSIAYGEDQRPTMAVHFPEVCYPAQGFKVSSQMLSEIQTPGGILAVKRLETSLAKQRFEPVTYWITIGQRVSLKGFERRFIEMEYALRGLIPDGLLIRVSSINRNSSEAWKDHDRFIRAMLQSLSTENLARMAPSLLSP